MRADLWKVKDTVMNDRRPKLSEEITTRSAAAAKAAAEAIEASAATVAGLLVIIQLVARWSELALVVIFIFD